MKSIENGPERNVELVITSHELRCAISSPPSSIDPQTIDHYEVAGMKQHHPSLITLTFVLTDGQRVRFYATETQLDMALLLDQLDGTIGGRRRERVDA